MCSNINFKPSFESDMGKTRKIYICEEVVEFWILFPQRLDHLNCTLWSKILSILLKHYRLLKSYWQCLRQSSLKHPYHSVQLLKGSFYLGQQNIACVCFKRCLGNFLMELSWKVISLGSLDLTLKYMIRREFKDLFGECKSHLYVIIFNEIERDRERRAKECFLRILKKIFIKEEGILLRGLSRLTSINISSLQRVLDLW